MLLIYLYIFAKKVLIMNNKPLNEKIHLNLRVNEETKEAFEDQVLDIKKEYGKHIKVTDMFRRFVDRVIEDPEAVVKFLNLKSK